ncbi:MAG TPA: PilZ domain-containing protein [Pyrinomonadaceae bacterium]|nr:PilZ domain-containing protein [Pyrinomonadaceae bacterium]
MTKNEIPDRRRGVERRTAKRYSVTIDIEWERGPDRYAGTVSDISLNGCFVLGGEEVNDGQSVTLFLPMGEGMKVQYAGTISNHVAEIGFAIRFTSLSDAQRSVLANFLSGEEESVRS